MTTRLLLVRHGATILSAEDRFAGSTDVDLSEEGRDQARGLAERLAQKPLSAAFASPMKRTIETASIVGAPRAQRGQSHGRRRCSPDAVQAGQQPVGPRCRHRQVLRSHRSRGAARASACLHHHDPTLAQSRRGRTRRAGSDDDGHAARRHHLAPTRQHCARRHGASVRRRASGRPPHHPLPPAGEQPRHQPRPVCRRLRGHRTHAGDRKSVV